MENLTNLESFLRSAELGGFSAAARKLALTPAAVSRNVATLEKNLGVRLFQRTTRRLALTEAGERLFAQVGGHVDALQAAIADASSGSAEPSGILKVSMSPHFGKDYILPLLPAFMQKYPKIRPEWTFENRQVDLVAEGYDAAIGGGLDLTPGLISRTLAPAHLIAVASRDYMKGRAMPTNPQQLGSLAGIQMRSSNTGRIRHWTMRNIAGEEMPAALNGSFIMNDPAAIAGAASLGLGVALIAVPDALIHFRRGDLIRLLPDWYADIGTISLYYANRKLLPAKTRVFIDFVTEHFRKERLAEKLAGSLGASNMP
ncbi:LysR family transcriptional regulator [Neorhizobium sp. NCHU2750]|uniref:LysR family transcriptional regulator n=1 Tax=Neorhizobium sp. NCHU2750 TaxID=1825976 RepID=UPI000E72811C|nr:LysR family transcriptional regulator [Neorhizobium sp. NCHU2750]